MVDLVTAQEVLRIVLVEDPAASDAIRELCNTDSGKARQKKQDCSLGNCLVTGYVEP